MTDKSSDHFISARWYVAASRLHIIGEQMMKDTMLLENFSDIFSVGNKGSQSKNRSLQCAGQEMTDRWSNAVCKHMCDSILTRVAQILTTAPRHLLPCVQTY